MKNHCKIDPSIAFCTKSASTNFNNFFDEKEVIFRKLINAYSNEIQKNGYIVIDKNQSAELGELTLIDYNTDSERLGDKVMNQSSLGKVIAYSKPNNQNKFYSTGKPWPQSNSPKNNAVFKTTNRTLIKELKYLPVTPELEKLINNLNPIATSHFFEALIQANKNTQDTLIINQLTRLVGIMSTLTVLDGGEL